MFNFNNVIYDQIDGIVIGSTLGPVLANIFVGFYESQLFENVQRHTLYYQYIDDTFALFGDEQEAISFFDQLELLHLSLRFTMEKNNCCLLFLDILVERSDNKFLKVYIINQPFQVCTLIGNPLY